MVYAMPDQTADRICTLLYREVVPFFGVPEAHLFDHGANLLSHLMSDACALLGKSTPLHTIQCVTEWLRGSTGPQIPSLEAHCQV